jgi:hypothetical protein
MPETTTERQWLADLTARFGESRIPPGPEARFIVSRGRKHDAELCCGRHLASTVTASTVTALTEGQAVGVTVTPVHAHTLELLRG